MIEPRGDAVIVEEIPDWKDLATHFGFEFKPGLRAMLETPAVRRFEAQDARNEESLKILEHPLAEKLFGAIFPGIVCGCRDGYQFYIYPAHDNSKSRRRRLVIALASEKSLELGMDIRPAGLIDRLLRFFNPLGARVTGDPVFDEAFKVAARNLPQVQVMLATDEARSAVLELWNTVLDLTIRDEGIRCRWPSEEISPADAEGLMARMQICAKRMAM